MPIFVTSTPPGSDFDREFAAWAEDNKEGNAAAEAARTEFKSEVFALDILCGSLLQVADKAIECYSKNTFIPQAVQGFIKPSSVKYCVGREVRGLPIGLIVYAARNQHMHFNEDSLREPSATVFERLATTPAHALMANAGPIRDPAFDLTNPSITSFASNVTALLGWRHYDDYSRDMHDLLKA